MAACTRSAAVTRARAAVPASATVGARAVVPASAVARGTPIRSAAAAGRAASTDGTPSARAAGTGGSAASAAFAALGGASGRAALRRAAHQSGQNQRKANRMRSHASQSCKARLSAQESTCRSPLGAVSTHGGYLLRPWSGRSVLSSDRSRTQREAWILTSSTKSVASGAGVESARLPTYHCPYCVLSVTRFVNSSAS